MDELQYEDIDMDGYSRKTGGNLPKYRNMSDVGEKELLTRLFQVCGNRKYFASTQEKSKWKKICRGIERDTIPRGWVESCYEWARGKNEDKVIVPITFSAVENLILNASRMKNWEAREQGMRNLDFVVLNQDKEFIDLDREN